MRKHITNAEIRRIFSNPNSLKKGMKLWKNAEEKGCRFIRKVKEERKRMLESLVCLFNEEN